MLKYLESLMLYCVILMRDAKPMAVRSEEIDRALHIAKEVGVDPRMIFEDAAAWQGTEREERDRSITARSAAAAKLLLVALCDYDSWLRKGVPWEIATAQNKILMRKLVERERLDLHSGSLMGLVTPADAEHIYSDPDKDI